MQEAKIWNMLIKHLGNEDSPAEREVFTKWLNEDEKNKALFHKIKTVWSDENTGGDSPYSDSAPTFFGRFTPQKMKKFMVNQAIGKLIGFIIGMWVTRMFSHSVLEKRGVNNLFGLNGRKKIVVNEIPEWLQNVVAILVGFIVLELINHFFQTKKHLFVWGQIKKSYTGLKENTINRKN